MGWGVCEDRKGLFEQIIFEVNWKDEKNANGLENTGSTGHLAPAGHEDVVVSEEVTHWAGEDGKKEKEVGRKGWIRTGPWFNDFIILF